MEHFDVPDAKRIFTRAGLALFISYSGSIVAAVLLNWLLKNTPFYSTPLCSVLIGVMPFYAVIIPVMYFMLKRYRVTDYERRKADMPYFLSLFPACFAVGAAGNIITRVIAWLIALIFKIELQNPVSVLLDTLPMPLLFVYCCVLAPVFEEYIFRRLLIDAVRPFGDAPAIVFSAICFALYHGNLSQFIYALFLGIIFGYVTIRTGRLIYPILLHSFINSFSLLGAYISSLGVAAYITAYSYAASAMLFGGIFILYRIQKKKAFTLYAPTEECAAPIKYVYLNYAMLLYIAVCLGTAALTFMG